MGWSDALYALAKGLSAGGLRYSDDQRLKQEQDQKNKLFGLQLATAQSEMAQRDQELKDKQTAANNNLLGQAALNTFQNNLTDLRQYSPEDIQGIGGIPDAVKNKTLENLGSSNLKLAANDQSLQQMADTAPVKGYMANQKILSEAEGADLDRLIKKQDYEDKMLLAQNKLKELSPELKGTIEKMQGNVASEIKQFGDETGDPMNRVEVAYKSSSAKADPLLAMSVAKMYNPKARINDDGTFQDTEGIPEQILTTLLKAKTGSGLLPEERLALYNLAANLYNVNLNDVTSRIRGNVEKMALRGVDKNYLDFPMPYSQKSLLDKTGNQVSTSGPPSGRKY